MQRVAIAFERGIAAIGREGVLQQVVRSEAHEAELARVGVRHKDGRRDLEHHPKVHVPDRLAFRDQFRPRPVDETTERRYVASIRDHRRHHLHSSLEGGAVARAQLRHEDVRPVVGHAERADSEEWVRLPFEREIGNGFVAAHVEQADRHRMRRACGDDLAIRLGLLALRRRSRSLEKQEFGPEESDAARAQGYRARSLTRRADIGEQIDRDSVSGDRRKCGFLEVPTPVTRDRARAHLVAGEVVGGGRNQHLAAFAVERKRRTAGRYLERREQSRRADDGGNPVRAREDGRVRGGRRRLERDAKKPVARQGRRDRGREIVRDDNGRLDQAQICAG